VIKVTVPYSVYLAASDGEEAFWAQLLMIVMLAAGGGIYAFIKTRPKSRRSSRGPISINHKIFNRGMDGVSRLIKTAGKQISLKRPALQQLTAEHAEDAEKKYKINSARSAVSAVKLSHAEAKRRDLKSGMELLSGSFLVKVIESRNDGIYADGIDIEMQKICFAEMKRRNQLEAVSSEALKAYTVDKAGYYGKTIHRQAMEELFRRTGRQVS
jgi:hypothetical protein